MNKNNTNFNTPVKMQIEKPSVDSLNGSYDPTNHQGEIGQNGVASENSVPFDSNSSAITSTKKSTKTATTGYGAIKGIGPHVPITLTHFGKTVDPPKIHVEGDASLAPAFLTIGACIMFCVLINMMRRSRSSRVRKLKVVATYDWPSMDEQYATVRARKAAREANRNKK